MNKVNSIVLLVLLLSGCVSTPYISAENSLNNMANMPALADAIEAERALAHEGKH